MRTRKIGPFEVSAIGLGCMNLSHAYGTPPPAEVSAALLHRALDLGYTFLDTAALYGFGTNETLIGSTLKERRSEYVLASKCGMTGVNGVRVIDGRPETLKRTCDESLARLQTDVIDLYYLHRLDKTVPIEESVGGLAALVKAGKVRTIGLSEVSGATIRRAHAVHPIAAVQTEYSLWTRNVEYGVRQACDALNIALVAFSPLARAFLTGKLRDLSGLAPKDLRRGMPRFQPPHFAENLKLLDGFEVLAREAGCTMGQLALGWLLAKGENIVPIPGTTNIKHLAENAGGADVTLSVDMVSRLDALINVKTVHGPRYNPAAQADIDTEEVPQ
ncbi:MAG: aldo/keto reductase [Alphaproteobacteria bacterium]|nr:aldo/keto reductase [Alphaproteobacteria bacterium]